MGGERSTFRIYLIVHIRVVLLEPFLTLLDGTPKLAILNQAFVSAETCTNVFW
jgi:hypothetical protein